METITGLVKAVNGVVWGPPMLVLILGTGLVLMIGLRFMPLLRLGYGFRMLWRGRTARGEGDITSFNALMTSLSATIGTGNIAGVGVAIAIGGPGALFWMWCTALVGMATKYAEAVLAVRYREVDERGNHVGGPMYYIKNGLGRGWIWLGVLFAVFGAFAGFGIGNMFQANSVASTLHQEFGWPNLGTGLVMAALAGLVLIGGIRWIAQVAGKLVPIMAVAYLACGLLVLVIEVDKIPGAIVDILTMAFTPAAGVGGFAGAVVLLAIQQGVARGIFSNEAGLGSAPIAHAAAETDEPVRQGTVAMLGTFIDTIIICTITGLVIVTSGQWKETNPEYLQCEAEGGVVSQKPSDSWGIEKVKNSCSVVEAACATEAEKACNEAGEGDCAQEAVESCTKSVDRVLKGAPLTTEAFESGLPNLGNVVVSLALGLFAFTTLLGWSVYGERCVEYLFGVRAILPFRVAWVLIIPVGAVVKLGFVIDVADALNALMAVPNLIALLLLSPVVFKITREYFAKD